MENYSYNSSYPESGGSSPRSREIDFENPPPWEESQNQPQSNYKVKFMCSYGGKIHPRPHDNQLSYVGGETKILAVDRNIKFNSLLSKLISLCDLDGISFKYQLPGEDLDALISVTNDDDLEHMMHEYDRLYRISPKPARLRIFIFPNGQSQNPSLNSSVRSFGSDEVKSEKERFVEALNAPPIVTPPPPPPQSAVPQTQAPTSNVDFLFGLEKANAMAAAPPPPQPIVGRVQEMEDPVGIPVMDDRFGSDPIQKHIQDLQRLRLEDQQRRKSDDHLAGGFTGGDYYKIPEKFPPVTVSSGVPYWTDKQVPGGVFPASSVNNEQPVYMIPAPANAYHPQMVRPVAGAPTQGYYTVQRIPSDVYREQQPMYNMISGSAVPTVTAAPPPQKVAGYSEAFGMVRPGTAGGVGVAAETGYAQVAYDSGMGRQVIYAAPGGVMGAQTQFQTAAQYQGVGTAVSGEMRPGGALYPEAGGKVVPKATQASV